MMGRRDASELALRLARDAEAVCRHYLSNGQRAGSYWVVGDARNSLGRSLYVRLRPGGSGAGQAGKWTDAATGEHGDLLDLIALNKGLPSFRDTLDEARAFLRLLPSAPVYVDRPWVQRSSPASARRLFAMARPVAGTLAEIYLRARGISILRGAQALRFHPRCWYREHDGDDRRAFPALIAAVTDGAGWITGVQRTWLDPSGIGKAPVASPRRAIGQLLGSGVRFGVPLDVPFPVMAAGEGIETVLSLRLALPAMPMIAGLSAHHLAALLLPSSLERLYLAVDADPAGRRSVDRLTCRAREAGIEALPLVPALGDFNEDLRRFGLATLIERLRPQLVPADAVRFLPTG